MKSFNNIYNSNIISLEEDNSYPKLIYRKRKGNNEIENSSNSFFSKIISKIGQGLKSIMSMKINIEDDDIYEPEVYNRINNRFNMREEMSLIDAPSFIDDYSFNYKKYLKHNNNLQRYNDSNNMIISHNETQRYAYNNNNDNYDSKDFGNLNDSFNRGEQEIINTDINTENNKEIKIESNLLTRKREREDNIIKEEIKEDLKEELKNDEIEKSLNKNNEAKKRIKVDNNNISDFIKKINSSINSLSIKSLDNLKNEIEQKKIDNLKNVEEMYQRNDLYYDYLKDVQMRANALDDYFKEKVKKIEIKKKKRKKEEEKKKFKVKKSTDLKFYCVPKKKPKIFAERKIEQFQFIGKPKAKIEPVNIDNNNNKNNINNNIIPNKLTGSFFTGNENNDKNNSISENDNKNKENNNKNETIIKSNNDTGEIGQEKIKLPVLISKEKNDDKNNEKENSSIKEVKKDGDKDKKPEIPLFLKKEQKPEVPLFSSQDPRNDIFSNSPNTTQVFPSPWGNAFTNYNPIGQNISNIENKKEEKPSPNIFERNKDIPKLFTGSSTNNKDIFSSKNPKTNESLFFGIDVNPSNQKNSIFNNPPKKEGLFNQQTSVSSSINETNLFKSNKPDEKSKETSIQNNPFFSKIENKTFNLFTNNPQNNDQNAQNNQPFKSNQEHGSLLVQPNSIFSSSDANTPFMPSKYGNDQGSLLSQNNPFLNNKTISNNNTNIFGNSKNDDKNVQNNQKQSLFGSFTKGSLFGN